MNVAVEDGLDCATPFKKYWYEDAPVAVKVGVVPEHTSVPLLALKDNVGVPITVV